MSPLAGVAKGNKFARAVAGFLGTEPRALCGALDRGDLVHPTWTVEVKCSGRGQPLSLSAAMTEARAEAVNAGTPDRYLVVTRRTGWPLDEAFVVLPLWMAAQVIPGLNLKRSP